MQALSGSLLVLLAIIVFIAKLKLESLRTDLVLTKELLAESLEKQDDKYNSHTKLEIAMRILVYKEMINFIIKNGGEIGLCKALRRVIHDNIYLFKQSVKIEHYPELMAQKPADEHFGVYWWHLYSKVGTVQRIDALNTAIEDAEFTLSIT